MASKNHENSRNILWRTGFHGVALTHHLQVAVQTINLDFSNHPDEDLQNLKQYAPRFLTAWNFAFQTLFLIIACIYDVGELKQTRDTKWLDKLKFWRDFVFATLTFPYTMFVASMFWTLFSIDRDLVYPASYDLVMTWSYNLSLHAWILAVLILEAVIEKKQRGDRRMELVALWTVQIVYALVYYITYLTTGQWLYRLFQHMNCLEIVIFQVSVWICIHIFYEIQFYVLDFIHCISRFHTHVVCKDIEIVNNCSKEGKRFNIEEISKFG